MAGSLDSGVLPVICGVFPLLYGHARSQDRTLENTFVMEAVPASLRATAANWRTFSFNVGWTAASVIAGVVVARFGFPRVFVASTILTFAGSLIWYYGFAGERSRKRLPLPAPIAASMSHPAES